VRARFLRSVLRIVLVTLALAGHALPDRPAAGARDAPRGVA